MTREAKSHAPTRADASTASAKPEQDLVADAYLRQAARDVIARRVAAFVAAWTTEGRPAGAPNMRGDRITADAGRALVEIDSVVNPIRSPRR